MSTSSESTFLSTGTNNPPVTMETFLQSQQHLTDALTALLNQQTAHAQPPANIIVPQHPHVQRVKLPLPDEYDSSPNKYNTFIQGVRAHLGVPDSPYTTPALQILFTLSLMKKGLATTWANERSQAIHDRTYAITSWDDFESLLQAMF
ncbi:hypothetical protein PAXRUDRAFT_15906 [Paxillus rubicundulus Ve08.2h10]|uniref:DUF4939 domain-containing protein n=1 Tax=Paxillus rubicundulus Ve08.2h10 TaxID=930991 RepID=A0A0D0D8Y7_9AGAM|nr:hypothetical protein PAXRUDRAFT_15906 [Paxillus rubicundulus Ve08.2h10]